MLLLMVNINRNCSLYRYVSLETMALVVVIRPYWRTTDIVTIALWLRWALWCLSSQSKTGKRLLCA